MPIRRCKLSRRRLIGATIFFVLGSLLIASYWAITRGIRLTTAGPTFELVVGGGTTRIVYCPRYGGKDPDWSMALLPNPPRRTSMPLVIAADAPQPVVVPSTSSQPAIQNRFSFDGPFDCVCYQLPYGKRARPNTRLDLRMALVPGFRDYSVPSVWPGVVSLLLGLLIVFVERRRVRSSTLCRCGYNLTGNVSGVCPECGTVVSSESIAHGGDGGLSPPYSFGGPQLNPQPVSPEPRTPEPSPTVHCAPRTEHSP